MASTLEVALLYLVAAVIGVVICRSLKLPPMLGYLVVGVVIGPNATAFQYGGGGSSAAFPPYNVEPLEALRNVQHTLAGRGFEMLFECHRETCGVCSGGNLWFPLIDRRALALSINHSWDTGR
jgi:hypothetical protein